MENQILEGLFASGPLAVVLGGIAFILWKTLNKEREERKLEQEQHKKDYKELFGQLLDAVRGGGPSDSHP